MMFEKEINMGNIRNVFESQKDFNAKETHIFFKKFYLNLLQVLG